MRITILEKYSDVSRLSSLKLIYNLIESYVDNYVRNFNK